MAGLLDIAPAVETVVVRGVDVPVYGVSAKGIASLLGRFPELRMLFSGKKPDAGKLMDAGPDVLAAIIAAGIGFPGDKAQEDAAARLAVDAQAELLAVIVRLTFPNGIGSLGAKFAALGSLLNVAEASAEAPATKSRKSSSN